MFAHNVHPTVGELERLAEAGSAVAHCPCSNAALGSGFFPMKRHLAAGVRIALGSDVGAGTGFGMLKEALQCYLLQRLMPEGVALRSRSSALPGDPRRGGSPRVGGGDGRFHSRQVGRFRLFTPARGQRARGRVVAGGESGAAAFGSAYAGRRGKRARGPGPRPGGAFVTLEEVNRMDRETFVATLGWVFEHSPWVAERAWPRRPFAGVAALHQAMAEQVAGALPEEQAALIRAHPDLGTRARMSSASSGEQAGAGPDHLTLEEYDQLQSLNSAYREKFDFPLSMRSKAAPGRIF